MKNIFLSITVALLASGTQAATVYQAQTNRDNAAQQGTFIADIETLPEFTLDFETGYSQGDRIDGPVGIGGLSILGIAQGGGDPIVTGGAGAIGGSNPIDNFALLLADDGMFSGNVLELNFTGPLAYLSFFVIDAAAHTVNFGSQSFVSNTTAASGNTAEFRGIVFDSSENISSVTIPYQPVGGTQGWAIDNIQFGYQESEMAPVPLPAGLPLLLLGIGAFGVLRHRSKI